MHATACAACREFLSLTLAEEARLERALRIEPPAGLQDRILARGGERRTRPRWLALAAGVVAAAGIALAIAWTRNDELVLAGIDFVMFEEAQSIVDAAPTDWSALAGTARIMGVSLPRELGDMRYVCVYPFAAGAAHHVLVKTPLGKLTLLLVPDRTVAARAAGAAHGFSAAVLPAGKGTIVIIGSSARSVRRAETLLKSA